MAVALPTTPEVANPQAQGYGASLDNLLLRLAMVESQPIRISTADTQPDRVSTEQNPEDITETFGRVFSRSDFSGGEGLAFMHGLRGDRDLDTRRFWDSSNIDVSAPRAGEIATIRLLRSTSQVYSDTHGNPVAVKLPSGNLLYINGSTLWNVTDPLGSPSRVSEDPHTGTQTVLGLAVLGTEAYAACGTDGIGKRSAGGTWSDMASAPSGVNNLWAVKQRIIADVGGQLQEINLSTGAGTNLGTALPPGESWNVLIEAGPVILGGASDGNIYAFHEQSGTLSQVSQLRLSNVDVPVSMAYASGVLMIGTAAATLAGGAIGRLWRAAVSDSRTDYVPVDIQLLRTWDDDDTADLSPGPMASTRESIYTSSIVGTEVHLWRYQLSTAGLSRSLEFASAKPIRSIVPYGDRMAVTIDTAGLWQQDTTYATSGYLVMPFADFFTVEPKRWVGMRAFYGNVTSLRPLAVSYATDPDALLQPTSPLWTPLATYWSNANSGVEVDMPLVPPSRWLGLKLVFSSDGNDTPEVQSVSARGYPTTDDVVVELPVNVSDRIERPNRRPITVPNWGHRMYAELVTRQGDNVRLELFSPSIIVDGVIEKVEVPVVAVLERGAPTLVSLVTVRGKLDSILSGGGVLVSPGSGSLGIGTLGVGAMGGL